MHRLRCSAATQAETRTRNNLVVPNRATGIVSIDLVIGYKYPSESRQLSAIVQILAISLPTPTPSRIARESPLRTNVFREKAIPREDHTQLLIMQRNPYHPRPVSILPDSAILPHLRAENYKGYREKVIRQIGDQIEDRDPTVFFTATQLAMLGDVAEWSKPFLEHVLDLSRAIARYPGDFAGPRVEYWIGWVKHNMHQKERIWPMPTELAVQETIREFRDFLWDQGVSREHERSRAAEQAGKESTKRQRIEAMESLVAVIRASISASPADIMDMWEGIEEQIQDCQGSITEEVEESLAKQLGQMWKKVQAPRRTGHIFWSTRPRPECPQAQLVATWSIPAYGDYNPETGQITYTTEHEYNEFYAGRHGVYPWSDDLVDPLETTKVFPIHPLKLRFSRATLNGKRTKIERELEPHEVQEQGTGRILALRKKAFARVSNESTSSQESEEL